MLSKFWGSMVILGIAVTANASDQLALETVKKMYETGKTLEKGNEIIALYADKNLSRAISVWDAAEYCIPYDVMWQSNDPPYHRSVSYHSLGYNQVKVDLGEVDSYEAASLIYNLNCSDGLCKVSDIEDSQGSLVHNIYQECR